MNEWMRTCDIALISRSWKSNGMTRAHAFDGSVAITFILASVIALLPFYSQLNIKQFSGYGRILLRGEASQNLNLKC